VKYSDSYRGNTFNNAAVLGNCVVLFGENAGQCSSLKANHHMSKSMVVP